LKHPVSGSVWCVCYTACPRRVCRTSLCADHGVLTACVLELGRVCGEPGASSTSGEPCCCTPQCSCSCSAHTQSMKQAVRSPHPLACGMQVSAVIAPQLQAAPHPSRKCFSAVRRGSQFWWRVCVSVCCVAARATYGAAGAYLLLPVCPGTCGCGLSQGGNNKEACCHPQKGCKPPALTEAVSHAGCTGVKNHVPWKGCRYRWRWLATAVLWQACHSTGSSCCQAMRCGRMLWQHPLTVWGYSRLYGLWVGP
jgi:hypothetical protein